MPAPYYIQVLGSRGHMKPHLTLESARTEAQRLFELFEGMRTVRIVETLQDLDATHIKVGAEVKPIPRIEFKRKRKLENTSA